MNETDDAVLEFFQDLECTGHRPWMAPTTVWLNLAQNIGATDRSRDTISRRMNALAEMGLLERVDEKRGYYRITEKGLAYLNEELDAEDIERPEVS